METKRSLIFVVAALLILTLSACERPASQAPTGATPTQAEFPVPGATSDDVMGQLESFATQTAIALQGGEEPVETTAPKAPETGEVQEPTATPEPPTVVPPTQSQVTVPSATPGKPSSYTLHKGEHPYCIARRFNVNPDEMLNLSGLGRGGSYPPGTVLKIPKTGNKFPANRALKKHPTTYTVVAGDTIYSIACAFGDADPNAIIAANNLTSPYKLQSGQSLQIP